MIWKILSVTNVQKKSGRGQTLFQITEQTYRICKAQKESASHDSAMCLCSCLGKKLGEKKSRRKGKKFKESISGASFKDRTMLKDRRAYSNYKN